MEQNELEEASTRKSTKTHTVVLGKDNVMFRRIR